MNPPQCVLVANWIQQASSPPPWARRVQGSPVKPLEGLSNVGLTAPCTQPPLHSHDNCGCFLSPFGVPDPRGVQTKLHGSSIHSQESSWTPASICQRLLSSSADQKQRINTRNQRLSSRWCSPTFDPTIVALLVISGSYERWKRLWNPPPTFRGRREHDGCPNVGTAPPCLAPYQRPDDAGWWRRALPMRRAQL